MRWLLVVLALGACSKKSEGGAAGSASAEGGDDCQRYVDRARPFFAKMAKESGRPFDDTIVTQLVTQCREMKKQGKATDEKSMKCVLEAKDDAAVTACLEAAFSAYKNKARQTEADLVLGRLGKSLKVAYVENAAYPKGSVPLTPTQDCCLTQGACPVDAAAWSNPIWQQLDFTIEEPHRFRYAYESDGATAVVTAVGDLDCDGTAITYKLEMGAAEGNPSMRIAKPDLSAD
jgi:hypothetical protein